MSESRPTSNVRRVDFGKAGDKAVAVSGRRVSGGNARLVDHPSKIDPDEAVEPAAVGVSTPIPAASPSGDGMRRTGSPTRKIVSLPHGGRGSRSTSHGRQNGVLILAVMLAAILGATLAAILLDPGL